MRIIKKENWSVFVCLTIITNAARVTFCCVIIFLFDRISLVTMLLCLLLSTFYAKSQGSLNVNGDVYVGEWKESKHHGYGTYKWVNGDVYVGEWKEGKQHGQGTYKWVNGDTHTGEWKGDDRHGLGTFKYASNGDEYSRYWEHGERCGEFLSLVVAVVAVAAVVVAVVAVVAAPTSKIDDPEHEILESRRECSICLEEFCQGDKRTSLPCKQEFHTSCVNTWFSTETSCPVCRRVCFDRRCHNAVDRAEAPC